MTARHEADEMADRIAQRLEELSPFDHDRSFLESLVPLLRRLATAEQERDEAQMEYADAVRDRDHWKANHDEQVRRKQNSAAYWWERWNKAQNELDEYRSRELFARLAQRSEP